MSAQQARPLVFLSALFLVYLLGAGAAWAGKADVVVARATCDADRVCTFSVSVKHADTGWKHYADRYEIVAPDGSVIATRVLAHPHIHEQPFTRKLAGVEVPPGIEVVVVRAHDSVHGLGGKEATVELTTPRATAPEAEE